MNNDSNTFDIKALILSRYVIVTMPFSRRYIQYNCHEYFAKN